MPTSAAADRVAEKLGIRCTRRRPAGSSSATCSMPARSRSAARKAPAPARPCAREGRALGRAAVAQHPGRAAQSVDEIVTAHWRDLRPQLLFRHDYEEVDRRANALMEICATRLPRCPGKHGITAADDFAYDDPVDGSRTTARASASCSRTARASSTACPAPAPRARRCASISSATSPSSRCRVRSPRSSAAHGRSAPTVIT
jgi:hypothetical protein